LNSDKPNIIRQINNRQTFKNQQIFSFTMTKSFIFTNIIGTFIFNERGKQIDAMLFKDISDYKEKEVYEKKLMQKHPDAITPEPSDLTHILEFFKEKKYFQYLRKRNLILTKDSIKNSVSPDILIIQAINTILDIEKISNTLTKRLRDWYSLYNPETSDRIKDHEQFVSLITKKSKKQLLKEFGLDESQSMGAQLKEKDVSAILLLATQISNFHKLKAHYDSYLVELEKESCPNLATVLGSSIAAKLIGHAGSLKRLAEMPASTLQIIGAEKALFRHMRNKKNRPPKYGMIHEHTLIQKSKKELHGKIARTLADKASIAVRVDYFKGKFIGDKLKKKLVEKFKIKY